MLSSSDAISASLKGSLSILSSRLLRDDEECSKINGMIQSESTGILHFL